LLPCSVRRPKAEDYGEILRAAPISVAVKSDGRGDIEK
jgi:hypothetical protein